MTTALIVLALAAILLFLFRFRGRSHTVVDGCVVRMWQDTHCTAIVEYRQGKRIVRLSGEVGISQDGGTFLWLDMPQAMYSDSGEVIGVGEYATVKDRISRGLNRLGIRHELTAPQSRER